jgi:hypothetical protein
MEKPLTPFKESFKLAAISYLVLVGITAMFVSYYYYIFDTVGQTQLLSDKVFVPLAAILMVPLMIACYFCTIPFIIPAILIIHIAEKKPYALGILVILVLICVLILIFIKRPFAWYLMLLSVSIFALIPHLITIGNPFLLTDTGKSNMTIGFYGIAIFPFYWGAHYLVFVPISKKLILWWQFTPKPDTEPTTATGNTLDAHLTDGNPDD